MKIFGAWILYRLVRLVIRGDRHVIVRNGITFEVDLSEGLDLSVFLFGRFQRHVANNRRVRLEDAAVILDVGANVGMMTLQFARTVPAGRVYAFEPTHYAFAKLTRNLELNPELAARVTPVQTFVSSKSRADPHLTAYASWKVDGTRTGGEHQIHRGSPRSAEGVGAIALDDFCDRRQIARVDFIKIDTDGHELEVLQGARGILRRFRPIVIFELGLYILRERNIRFDEYLDFFAGLGYSLLEGRSLKTIDGDNYLRRIPSRGTVDILALCDKARDEDV